MLLVPEYLLRFEFLVISFEDLLVVELAAVFLLVVLATDALVVLRPVVEVLELVVLPIVL